MLDHRSYPLPPTGNCWHVRLSPAIRIASIAMLVLLTAGSASAAGPAYLADRAAQACAMAGAAGVPGGGDLALACRISDFERQEIAPGIGHYSFVLQVGSGEHDVIGIHRVVREVIPGVPVAQREAMMMVHGARVGFRGTFLAPLGLPGGDATATAPVFFAANGIDVWGIDLRAQLLPPGLGDLSFTADWTTETEIADLGAALAVARFSRLIGGSGYRQLHLLGFSLGGALSYAYLNEESQLRPWWLRHVKSFIVGDIFYTSDDPQVQADGCAGYQAALDNLAAGDYAFPGAFFNMIGQLALDDPTGASPVIPALTNADVSILFGSDAPEEGNIVPFFHQVAGSFMPPASFDLLFTAPEVWFNSQRQGAEWLPAAPGIGIQAVACGAVDTPLDDHLADIRVPVLYLGAGGGVGEYGLFTLGQLGSDDITVEIVDLEPPELRFIDYGHSDLFLAADAEERAWQPILDWLQDR